MKKRYYDILGEKYAIPCVEYAPDGEAAKGVIIALHGFGGDKESSAVFRLAEKAVKHDLAVVCIDFPAHGKSTADERFLTVENCKNDVETTYAFVENDFFDAGNGSGKIHFFATSFGGYILAHVLEKPLYKSSKAVFRSPAVNMAETFVEKICNLTIVELAKRDFAECGFERKLKLNYDFYADLEKHNIRDVSFDNKCLMIYGDRDTVVRPQDMEAFAAVRPNITVKCIEGADHRYKGEGHLELAVRYAVDFLK